MNGRMQQINQYWRSIWLALLIWSLIGCQADAQGLGQQAFPPEPKEVSLGIIGYNYTDRYINTFSVNGHGGGNLFVSSPTSGGGGTTCCVPYFPGLRSMALKIKWQYAGCVYHVRSTISDEIFDRIHPFFKEVEVEVEPPLPRNAKYAEVHFFADGSVKAFLTETASPPRLQLPEQRADRSHYPRCPDDKKPAD